MRLMLASLLALVGCSSNPLVGTWDGPTSNTLGAELHAEVKFDPSTVSYSLVGSGTCSGTLTYAGYSWLSDAVTLTFSGTPTCSGAVTCGALKVDCGQTTQSSTLGACTYIF